MKHLWLIFLVAGFFPSFAFSGESAAKAYFDSPEEFAEWMMYYYQNPEPQKLPCGLTYYVDSSLFDYPSGRMATAHFYGAILSKDDFLLKDIFDMLTKKGSERAKSFGLHVLWITDIEVSRQLLREAKEAWTSSEVDRIFDRMMQQEPTSVLDRPLDNPDVLDNLWATFFATGDELPVKRIASAVHLVEDGSGLEMVVGGAAQWSLTANARQHPRVREIVINLASQAEGTQKKMLEEILNKSEEASLPVDQ